MNATANTRFRKIAEFIQKKIADAESAANKMNDSYVYRWQHTQRVSQYGLQLAKAEGANQELCITACLLHDLAKFENQDYGVDHGRVGAKLALPLLQKLGYEPIEIDTICFSIANHVDNQAGFEHPLTMESKIVSDADTIDRFSTYRLLSSLEHDRIDYKSLIENAEKRLLTLKKYQGQNMMATSSGNALFNQQIDLQIMFIQKLIAESNLTCLPEI